MTKWGVIVLESGGNTILLILMTKTCPPFPFCVADGCVEEHLLLYPHGLQGLHSLQSLVPSLLRHEVEVALEKLDVVWDRTYAWDMFLDMMVR